MILFNDENAGKYPVSKPEHNPDNTLQMYDPLKTVEAYTRRESNNKTRLFLPGTFFFIIFSLFYFSAFPLFAERTQTAKQMTLQQNTATIRVEYEPARKSIAEYYLEKAINYIPALEQYLDASSAYIYRSYIHNP